MATDTGREIETFYQFLGQQIMEGSVDLSPEECVEAFRAYQRDLNRLNKELQPAIDRFDRGEPGLPFDAEDVERRGRERLAREGITD
ncbi:MAG: hypothetical protein ACHRXM_02505 [Isosphaerales bacterium]